MKASPHKTGEPGFTPPAHTISAFSMAPHPTAVLWGFSEGLRQEMSQWRGQASFPPMPCHPLLPSRSGTGCFLLWGSHLPLILRQDANLLLGGSGIWSSCCLGGHALQGETRGQNMGRKALRIPQPSPCPPHTECAWLFAFPGNSFPSQLQLWQSCETVEGALLSLGLPLELGHLRGESPPAAPVR